MVPGASISIAMATYNGAPYIQEQLESFAAQTRLPDELIVTDDGSIDATPEIVEDFALRAPFKIKLYRNANNLGWAKNFERAISLCSGDLIFLSDQDDVWFPNKLEKVEQCFMSREELYVVINDALLADEQLRSSGQTQRNAIANAANADRNFFNGCCSAHRRSWHDIALPVPSGLAHDYWLNALAIQLGCAHQMHDVLQLYRRHDSASSEWVLSNPRGVSALKGLSVALANPRPGWQVQLRLLRLARDRILEREVDAAAHGLLKAIPNLEREIAALERRMQISTMPRRRRLLEVVHFWAAGGYKIASGWKSALTDILRS